MPNCVFCFALLDKLNERNLVDSKSGFNALKEFGDLEFVVHANISRHICRKCLGLLKTRRALKTKLKELNETL